MSRIDKAGFFSLGILVLVATVFLTLYLSRDVEVVSVVETPAPSLVDELLKEPEELKVYCSDTPKYPERREYQITCWSEPSIIGYWAMFEYVNGEPEFRTESGPMLIDSFTVFLPTDPGPFVRVYFDPADGGGAIVFDMPVDASHLKKGIQNLPGRGSFAKVI